MNEPLATGEEGSAATEDRATTLVAAAATTTTATATRTTTTTSVVEKDPSLLLSSPQDKQQTAAHNVISHHDNNKEEVLVGGTSDTAAFCLLDGFLLQDTHKGDMDEDHRSSASPAASSSKQQRQRIRVPIVRLPAILGRTHGSAAGGGESSNNIINKDPHFVALGKIKALSRHHVRIEYRTPDGTLGQQQKKQQQQQQQQQTAGDDDDDDDDENKFVFDPVKEPDELLLVGSDSAEGEPGEQGGKIAQEGSYVITCLGKNRIFVNKQRLDPGQSAVLTSGTALRIASLGLYFLLPKEKSKTTMEVNLPSSSSKESQSLSSSSSLSPKKKRKQPATMAVAPPPAKKTTTTTTSHKKPKRASAGRGTAKAAKTKTMQAEIDAMSTDDLLEQMADAVENDIWERRHQLIGSTIGSRAVVEAARDPDIQQRAQENGGVSRSEIMEWIADSHRFGEWVTQMLGKLEDKSYQASITKALIKTGFVRTASTGRYIKWLLPTNIYQNKGAAAAAAAVAATTSTETKAKDAGHDAEKEGDRSDDGQNDEEEASQEQDKGESGDQEEEGSEQEDGGSEKSDGGEHDAPEDEEEEQESNANKEAVSDNNSDGGAGGDDDEG